MGLDILDLVFRLERTFRLRISRQEFFGMISKHCPPDVKVGELFDYVRSRAIRTDAFDEDLDAEILWPMFQRAISDSMGVDRHEITKDRYLIRELGAGSW